MDTFYDYDTAVLLTGSVKIVEKCEFLRITNDKSPRVHTCYIATSPIKEVTLTKSAN